MGQSAGPLTDAFGTRLDPDALIDGLDALGLQGAALVVEDGGAVLECDAPDPRRDDVARAATWLRSRLSPLVPLRVRQREDGASRFRDARTQRTVVIALAEVSDHDAGFEAAVEDLLRRLGVASADRSAAPRTAVRSPEPKHALLAGIAADLARAIEAHVTAPASLCVFEPAARGVTRVSAEPGGSGPEGPRFAVWFRPGRERGVRPAAIVAASLRDDAIAWLEQALSDDGPRSATLADGSPLLLDGLAWRAARRPTLAAPATGASIAMAVAADRCIECGACETACPTGYLDARGRPTTSDPDACIRCGECVDACPTDALRPVAGADTATLGSVIARRPGWLSRLAGLPGPSVPAPFTPSFLRATPRDGAPRYVLGLAVMTMQEHAAVLLRDGELVGAVELERLVRVRHAGWHPEGRPGVTAAIDPTICLEETFCRRPIRWLLEEAGIALDDVDVIAVNGLHGRFAGSIPFVDPSAPVPTMRTGRVVYLPHHLCHAASAYRPSGATSAWIVTADGRGDRECAAVFRAEDGRIELRDTVLSLDDRSIGGVYEGVTRVLGLGSHGQGSTMALASFGEPSADVSPFLSVSPQDRALVIHESGIDDAFASHRRAGAAPFEERHHDLAASLQAALEEVAVELVRRTAGDGPLDALCLGGGVMLNCRMNERLRRTFAPRAIFAQPGANDAGTALGAALEADAMLGRTRHAPMEHSYLGPGFDDEVIEGALARSGLAYERPDDIAVEAAERLAGGEVVCWFQGRMELGPRALGARSILADPRDHSMHARVNRIKQREAWRPFGPSILAGHEDEWLDGAFDARFMLFTMPVAPAMRARIPAVVHVDGTTRPQVVHAETSPRYHALIAAFHQRTGVPMVLNTSFNRRGEPIVCTPSDAIDAFRELGADALAIGSFLALSPQKERAAPRAVPTDAELARLPGGRRLQLRLTTRCDLDCGHCTLRDQHGRPDRSFEEAVRALAEGRTAGCDELVVLRGEAALRDDLPAIVGRARAMGYRFVQLQTNALALAAPARRDALLAAGVDAFDVMLVAADDRAHDEITRSAGALRGVATAIASLVRAGRDVLVTVPVLRRNVASLASIVALLQKLGVRRLQLSFPRPVDDARGVHASALVRLDVAAPRVEQAARLALSRGMSVTTEGFPLCRLPPELHERGGASLAHHRVDDLHLVHADASSGRAADRPEPPPCRACAARDRCPRTWGAYVELHGSDELVPFAAQ